MIEFANITDMQVTPGLSAPFDVATTGDKYTTPAAWQRQLQDLARLSYVRGRLRYRVNLDAASASGAATLKLMAGAVELGSAVIDLTAGTEFVGGFDVDLQAVGGSALLSVVLNVGTAAEATRKAQVLAVLEVAHPVVFGA